MFATLRALVEVMKELAKDAAPEVGRLILEEVRFTFYCSRSLNLLIAPLIYYSLHMRNDICAN